jgi:hypothetical protein
VLNASSAQFEANSPHYNQTERAQQLGALNFNCDEDFWTVNGNGDIQQWKLIDGVVSGGAIVLTGGGNGLAISGDMNNYTFYCGDYPNAAITYYNDQNTWVTIPTSLPLTNNGAYGTDQFYLGNSNKSLYHFDGTTLSLVEELVSDYYTVADIAVDGLGRAWIFKGLQLFAESLEVYDSTGNIMSFDIAFDTLACYGSFFLNDTLYIGVASSGVIPNSIIPIILNGNTASLGTPIPFPYNNYYDFASCQNANPLSVNEFETFKNDFHITPNPTQDVVNLPQHIDYQTVEVINLTGQLVRSFAKNDRISLEGLTNGLYMLKIVTENGMVIKKVIKE